MTGKSGWENFQCQGFRQSMETMGKRGLKASGKLELSREYKGEVQGGIKMLLSVKYQERAGTQKPPFCPPLSTPGARTPSVGVRGSGSLRPPAPRAVLSPCSHSLPLVLLVCAAHHHPRLNHGLNLTCSLSPLPLRF